MKSFLLLLVYLFFAATLQAQDSKPMWRILEGVIFKQKTVKNYKVDYPVFGKEVQALQGEEITIRGYYLPVEVGGQNKFILSAFPYSNCYFCGGAGPETVMEVYSKEKILYTAKPITLKGKLRLNAEDLNHLMYILEEAERID
jgi:hypothetical protein